MPTDYTLNTGLDSYDRHIDFAEVVQRRLKAERLSRRLKRARVRVLKAFELADNPLLSPTAQAVADADLQAADRERQRVECAYDVAIRLLDAVTHDELTCLRYAGRA